MLDVILCSYNSEKTIEECISSILAQSFKFFTLYVFDDASTDRTVSLVKKFNDDRITIVSSKKNIGTYAAKNFIFKNLCKSPFIALHDADDISEERRFEFQINAMQICGIKCLGTCVTEFWEDGSIPHTISLIEELGLKENQRGNMYPPMLTKDCLPELEETLSPSGTLENFFKFKFCMNGSVMFSEGLLDALGGWDGHTRVGGDTDIFIRSLAFTNVYNLQEFLYNRRFHKESLTASKDWGMSSELRREYAFKRLDVIKAALEGEIIYRDLYYPEFEYEIIKCAD